MDTIVQIPTIALIGFVVITFGKVCEILLLKFMPQHSTLTEDKDCRYLRKNRKETGELNDLSQI